MANIDETDVKVIFEGDASSLNQTFEDLVNGITRTREELQQYKNDKEKSAELSKQLYEMEMQLVDVMKKSNNAIDSTNVSYRQLNDILKDLNRTYKNVGDSAQRMKIAPAAKSINSELKTMDANIGQFQRNVGNYAGDIDKAFSNLQLNTQQVIRELPSLKYGFSQFFLAISNNIPMLIDTIKRYNELNKVRKASAVNAAADAAAHKQEGVGTAESTAAHEAETKAVAASSSQHLREVEAILADAKAQKENAVAIRSSIEARIQSLLAEKDEIATKMADIATSRKMVVSDQELVASEAELRDLRIRSSAIDREQAALSIELTAAKTDEAIATQNLARAQKEYDKIQKESQAQSAIKGIIKAIFSWQTAIMLLIVALTLWTREIGHFFSTIFSGNKELKRMDAALEATAKYMGDANVETTKYNRTLYDMNKALLNGDNNVKLFYKEQKELNKAANEGAKAMAKEYVELRLLVSVMNDWAKSTEDHNKAAAKLLTLLGETTGATNIAAMKAGEYDEKIKNLTKSLYKNAQAQGVVKLLEQEFEKVLDAQGKVIDAELAKQEGRFKNFFDRIWYYYISGVNIQGGGNGVTMDEYLGQSVDKAERKLGEAQTTFETFLATVTKMFNFDELFGGDNGGGNGPENWWSKWEMFIKKAEAEAGRLVGENGVVNLADAWKYSAEGYDYYMKKFDEYVAHYKDNEKELKEIDIQRTQYLQSRFEYLTKLAMQWQSASKTERQKDLDALEEWYEQQKAIYEKAGVDTANLEAEYNRRKLDIERKYVDNYVNVGKEGMDLELANLETAFQKELEEYERKGIETVNLTRHYEIEKNKIISKYAKMNTEAILETIKREEEERKRAINVTLGWENQGGENRYDEAGNGLTGGFLKRFVKRFKGLGWKGLFGGKDFWKGFFGKDFWDGMFQDKSFAQLGGTMISPHMQRQNEISAKYAEYGAWSDSMNAQIDAMQQALESGKLVGEEKLEMETKLAEAERELALGTSEYQMELNHMVTEDTRQTVEERLGYFSSGFQAIGDLFNSVYEVIEADMDARIKEGKLSEEEASKQLEKYRGVKAAGAMIDALGAATSAYASMAGIPTVGPALGAIAAAAALAAGIANVRQIMAVSKDNPGKAVDSYAGMAPALSDFQPTYVTTVTNQDNVDYLVNALNEKPIQAYVVESDVTAAQELANKRSNEASW